METYNMLLFNRFEQHANLKRLLDMIVQSQNTSVFDDENCFFPSITDVDVLCTILEGGCIFDIHDNFVSDTLIEELNQLVGFIFHDFDRFNQCPTDELRSHVLKKHHFELGDLACRVMLEQDQGVVFGALSKRSTLLLGAYVTNSKTQETSFAEICKIHLNDGLSVNINPIFWFGIMNAVPDAQELANQPINCFKFDKMFLLTGSSALTKREMTVQLKAKLDVVELSNLHQQYQTILQEHGHQALLNHIFQSFEESTAQQFIETLCQTGAHITLQIDELCYYDHEHGHGTTSNDTHFNVRCFLHADSDVVMRNIFKNVNIHPFNTNDFVELLKKHLASHQYHNAFSINDLLVLNFTFKTKMKLDKPEVDCISQYKVPISVHENHWRGLAIFIDEVSHKNCKERYNTFLSVLINALLKFLFDNDQQTLKWDDRKTYQDYVLSVLYNCMPNISSLNTAFHRILNVQFVNKTGSKLGSTEIIKLNHLTDFYLNDSDSIEQQFTLKNGSLKINLDNPNVEQQVYYIVNQESQLAKQLQIANEAFKIMNVTW